ncbi:MAG: Lrp/AsnC family transcriptional regulator [Magnetospirillum sp. WYHS-4]
MPNIDLDETDLRILAALQADGRLTNVDLAARIGLSPSPCLRRVRRLEDAGAIRGYRAILDPERLGLGVRVFVAAGIDHAKDPGGEGFQAAVRALPEVVACYVVSGDSDFLLEVVAADLAAYSDLVLGTLLKLPGVTGVKSNFAIATVKRSEALPLPQAQGRPEK